MYLAYLGGTQNLKTSKQHALRVSPCAWHMKQLWKTNFNFKKQRKDYLNLNMTPTRLLFRNNTLQKKNEGKLTTSYADPFMVLGGITLLCTSLWIL